jgi:hypothetical protein
MTRDQIEDLARETVEKMAYPVTDTVGFIEDHSPSKRVEDLGIMIGALMMEMQCIVEQESTDTVTVQRFKGYVVGNSIRTFDPGHDECDNWVGGGAMFTVKDIAEELPRHEVADRTY